MAGRPSKSFSEHERDLPTSCLVVCAGWRLAAHDEKIFAGLEALVTRLGRQHPHIDGFASGRFDRGLEGVERAGADVAIDDAKRADCQAPKLPCWGAFSAGVASCDVPTTG